ncbi:hypothetical protein [Pectobacterium odoriferum]|uniref:hypothetical protein n=1 Tax=Pectobacterium odoriferum TaxID=78398 RepID=UPI000CD00805|nr:hypothetical protein [Pectobacterium odoriferum]POE02673.1 hypothetical protein BVY05_07635 [Pectobacterium odoriferum]
MNALTVSLVTIMIPGVIMALIFSTYTQHKPWDSFRYILMSVVFGILTYLVMQVIVTVFQVVIGIQDTKAISWKLLSIWSVANGQEKITINPLEVLLGGILAIPLGLLSVFLATKRTIHNYLLNKGISNKYGDDNVFIRSVEEVCQITPSFPDAYVLINEDSLVIHGVIKFYNENDKTQEIGFCNATVYNSETSDIIFKTNFLYLSKEYGKMIVFKNYLEIHDGENS